MSDVPVSQATVAFWIERYVRAWETNDPAAIGELFAEEARYYPRPDEDPWRNRAGIVAGWLERKDEPGTWSFRSQILAVTDEVAFVRGWTHYVDPAADYSNLWAIRFDEARRCVEFTEWWMEQGQRDATASSGGTDERGGA